MYAYVYVCMIVYINAWTYVCMYVCMFVCSIHKDRWVIATQIDRLSDRWIKRARETER